MKASAEAALDDLAFMRALVEAKDNSQRPFGEIYLSAGLIYGAQMLLHAGQLFGLVPTSPLVAMAVGLGPTAVFLLVLWWITRRQRGASAPSPATRAIQAVFGAVGAANLALVGVVGSVALRHKSLAIWLIYPCAVFVLQGAAWLVAFALRKRFWQALLGAGWFVAALVMAFNVDSLGRYILTAGVAFLALMAGPGAAMIRASRRDA